MKQVAFYRWRIISDTTGRIYTTHYLMSEADAMARHPEAVRVESSKEFRNLPETVDEFVSNTPSAWQIQGDAVDDGTYYGVKANVKAPHRFLRHGALCWVLSRNPGGGGDHLEIRGMSRGGRMVETWVDARDLTNYRAGWVQVVSGRSPVQFKSREAAQAWADAMNTAYGSQGVRPHAASFGTTRSQ